MENSQSPLSVYLIWHEKSGCKKVIDYCFYKLTGDMKYPFSRRINIPIYFRTGTSLNKIPKEINVNQANKNVILIFIDKYMVIDKEWNNYIATLYEQWQKNHNILLCPISLDKTAYNIDSPVKTLNYIRYHEMEEKEKNHLLFVNIANELCRFIDNQSEHITGGTQKNAKPVKLFISHTKVDKKAVELSHRIKDRIDNTSLKRFFDTYDIPPCEKFDKKIREQLFNATIVSIHSDSYSSRPWCQKEIIIAKDVNRPMVIVDFLENYEDRRFPYISNAPTFHLSPDKKDYQDKILAIIEVAMQETLRFTYCKYYLQYLQNIGLAPTDCKILCRPPELKDLNGDASHYLYPDPPIEFDEIEILSATGKKSITPLTWHNENFDGLEIGISISEPGDDELLSHGFYSEQLNLILYEVSRHLLVRNSCLSYGGDIRPGGFTEFLFEIVGCQKEKLKHDFIKLKSYQSWPIYLSNNYTEWMASNHQLAEFIQVQPPSDIKQEVEKIKHTIEADTVLHQYLWSRSLTQMRKAMIRDTKARIFIGGRTIKYNGKMPGILEEILISLNYNKPIYLNGCFGGVTGAVIDTLRKKRNKAITYEWQVEQSPLYAEYIKYFNEHKPAEEGAIDYNEMYNTISGYSIEKLAEYNGLSVEENNRLFDTSNSFEVIRLILKGLNKITKGKDA